LFWVLLAKNTQGLMVQVGKPRSVSTKENTTDGTDAYYRNADCQAIARRFQSKRLVG
jgi:hypothetical protein